MSNPKAEISIKARELLGKDWCKTLAEWYGITPQGMRNYISQSNPAGIHKLLKFINQLYKMGSY